MTPTDVSVSLGMVSSVITLYNSTGFQFTVHVQIIEILLYIKHMVVIQPAKALKSNTSLGLDLATT